MPAPEIPSPLLPILQAAHIAMAITPGAMMEELLSGTAALSAEAPITVHLTAALTLHWALRAPAIPVMCNAPARDAIIQAL